VSSAVAPSETATVAIDATAAAERLLRGAGARQLSPQLGLWSLDGAAAARLVPRLRRLGALRYAEPARRRDLFVQFTDPLTSPERAYHLYTVGVDRVEQPGPGFPVTVIDSGIDLGNPEFAGRPDVVELNPQLVPTTAEGEYHGTQVATVAAAARNGIGTEGVYSTAALRSYDLEGDLSDPSIIAAIEASVAAGPSVINISLGGPGDSRALCEAIARAVGLGSLVVAAAGNELREGNPAIYPASCPHVLTVGSVGPTLQPSPFSSASAAVDLAAPGERLPVTLPDGSARLTSGTSFAAPVVSAAAAWVRTVRGPMHHTQLFDLLRFSARDAADPGFDQRTGFGVLDLPAALTAALPPVDPQEPNDDVAHVAAGGLFERPKQLVSTRFRARLDATEDPRDVYRVSVPPGRRLTATVAPTDDVAVALYAPDARTVLRPQGRLAFSDRFGASNERVVYTNRTRRAVVLHLAVAPALGSGAANPQYTVTLTRMPSPRR